GIEVILPGPECEQVVGPSLEARGESSVARLEHRSPALPADPQLVARGAALAFGHRLAPLAIDQRRENQADLPALAGREPKRKLEPNPGLECHDRRTTDYPQPQR